MNDTVPTTDEVRALTHDIEDLRAGLAQLSSELGDLASVVVPPAREVDPPSDIGYGSLLDWVEGYFLPMFQRFPGGDVRWCNTWVEHPEAIVRLTALWTSWESLRQDPALGLANWLTSYLDPQLAVLLARSGPFAQCTPARHVGSAIGDRHAD